MNLAARLLVFAFLAGIASASLACSCWHPSPRELVEAHELIFFGSVAEVDQKAGIATFTVHKAYKGEAADGRVTIMFNNSPGASCGISFSKGMTHTVFASLRGDRYHTGLCSMIPYQSSPFRFQPALDAYALDAARSRK